MNFLIDTNILIPLEPTTHIDLGINTEAAINFFNLVQKSHNKIFIHPDIIHDIKRDENKIRADLRKKLIKKYHYIPSPPNSDILLPKIPLATEYSNNWVDNQLLASIFANVADYLVTEDIKIHKKARRIGIASQVILLSDAVNLIRDMFDETPKPPPAVEEVYVHQINNDEPIFESLREDYNPEFDLWLQNCKRNHRKAYIIRNPEKSNLAGICIRKKEDCLPNGKKGKTLKLCTIKVAPEFEGNRYGELILKAVFEYVRSNNYKYAYFTVYPKYKKLIIFAMDFGFYKIKSTGKELVFAKDFGYTDTDKETLSSIEFNKKFGPFVTSFNNNSSFVIPIRPKYHAMLFPEYEKQKRLWPGEHPCGNSIKKAYLSHSKSNQIKSGDNIFFYRSQDSSAITVIGIVEETFRSKNPNMMARYVGKRTVYTYNEIKRMCEKKTLAIKFRLVSFLRNPITLKEIITKSLLKAAPQSITKIGENIQWIQEKIKM